MNDFFTSVTDFITNYYLYIIIVILIIVFANLLYFAFGKKKKSNVVEKQPVVEVTELSEEEKKKYTDKIKFLEARVKELEDSIKVYEGEINEAKMSTLNLTKALKQMRNEDEDIEDTYDEDDEPVSIVNTSNLSEHVESQSKIIEEEQSSESSEVELPENVIQIRDVIYANIRNITERYKAMDENATDEERNSIVADFNKAKMQLAQYKEIEQKYINKHKDD